MAVVDPSGVICASSAVEEGGAGFRFEIRRGSEQVHAFVVRFDGEARAYENRCAHVPVQLDWMEGRFFDTAGLYLICATHGATYLPESGRCVAGPCKGSALTPVPVMERDGSVFLLQESSPNV